jgi:PLP dependent protein
VSSPLRSNLERVRRRIASACAAAGRAAGEVRLVAVTKSVGEALAVELAELGQVDLGESRVQELERKAPALAEAGHAVRWHLIGHLQRNKVRKALAHASEIHSIDSLRLLETLSRAAEEVGSEVDVYLEVKLVDLAERSGFAPADIPEAVERAAALPRLRLKGLMAIAAEDPRARPGDLASQDVARRGFAQVRELASRLPRQPFASGRPRLSMGMTSDLEAAIHEGSDVVRVGSALFTGLAARPIEGPAAGEGA